MHFPPTDPFQRSRRDNPKDMLAANPATLRRRVILGLIGIAVGMPCSVVGFYEVSVFNPHPPEWYGLILLILGLLFTASGVLALIFAYPKLFDSGDRGI